MTREQAEVKTEAHDGEEEGESTKARREEAEREAHISEEARGTQGKRSRGKKSGVGEKGPLLEILGVN